MCKLTGLSDLFFLLPKLDALVLVGSKVCNFRGNAIFEPYVVNLIRSNLLIHSKVDSYDLEKNMLHVIEVGLGCRSLPFDIFFG